MIDAAVIDAAVVDAAATDLPATPPALLAFPGAEGLGKHTVGGRGGEVIKVSNLNDSGPGSLRAAVMTPQTRIVVFEVSGNINLTTILTITSPYLTLAGQTSPGGVAVSGKQFNVATHEVIIQHMRFRSGGHEYTGNNSDGDSFSIWGPNWNGGNLVYNVILDRSSITWGTDETLSVTGGATATTIQRCLIAEGLKYAKESSNHSKGLMVSGKYNYDVEVSLYRNYIAHNWDRNPLLYNPEGYGNALLVEGANNVIYGWKGGSQATSGGDARVNWTDNYAKLGALSNANGFIFAMSNRITPAVPLIYVEGNIGDNRASTDPEWLVGEDWTFNPLSTDFQRPTPWPLASPLPSATMNTALAQTIVAESGASVPVRDAVDTRIVESFAAGTGTIPDTVTYPGDWPTYATPTPATDTDDDGMPDSWESTHGLNNQVNDAALDEDGNGYTNIEEYLHALSEGTYP